MPLQIQVAQALSLTKCPRSENFPRLRVPILLRCVLCLLLSLRWPRKKPRLECRPTRHEDPTPRRRQSVDRRTNLRRRPLEAVCVRHLLHQNLLHFLERLRLTINHPLIKFTMFRRLSRVLARPLCQLAGRHQLLHPFQVGHLHRQAEMDHFPPQEQAPLCRREVTVRYLPVLLWLLL